MENLTNTVEIIGRISEGFKFNHEIYGEKFYNTKVEIERTSGVVDVIPVLVSERLVNVNDDLTGDIVQITGQVRTYNSQKKLLINVFCTNIEFKENGTKHKNYVLLDGFVCKETVYRETPLGREIADLLIAVNRPYGKSDYIPCICWGRSALFASGIEVGQRVSLMGRIQSRAYVKKLEDGTVEDRVAMEVSTTFIKKVNDDEEN